MSRILIVRPHNIHEGWLTDRTFGMCTCGKQGEYIEYNPDISSFCRCQNCYNLRKLQLALQGRNIENYPYSMQAYGVFRLAGAIVQNIVRKGQLVQITHDSGELKQEKFVCKGRIPRGLIRSSIVSVTKIGDEYEITFLKIKKKMIRVSNFYSVW